MRRLIWFFQNILFPFILGLTLCVGLAVLFDILHVNYLAGWANDGLLFFSLPKILLWRPISDLVPFSLMFIMLYHLYNFAKDSCVCKACFKQFVLAITSYFILNSILPPLLAIGVCVIFPFLWIYIRDRRLGLYTNYVTVLASPFQLVGWLPGCLFGMGLAHGFLVALPCSVLLVGGPCLFIALLCRSDKES